MWFAKNKIRKRNLYFRNIMALSVPHMWKKGIFPICLCVVFPKSGNVILTSSWSWRGYACTQWDIPALSGEKTWPPLPVSPFSFLCALVPFNIYTKLSLIVMVIRLKPGAEPCCLFPRPSCSQGENPQNPILLLTPPEILQLLSSTDIWFSKK